MARYHNNAMVPGGVTEYRTLTPLGGVVTDAISLFLLAVLAFVGTWVGAVVIMVLVMGVSFWEGWRWALTLAAMSPLLLAAGCYRLIGAYIGAALERLAGRDLDHSGSIGDLRWAGMASDLVGAPESVRLIPFRGVGRLVDNVPEEDVLEFISQLGVRGHTKRAWTGYTFRSGRTCDYDTWRTLCNMLIKAGLLEGVSERSAGVLRSRDPAVIVDALRL